MKIPYWRYSATGNTFLIFDNREGHYQTFDQSVYEKWCSDHEVDGLLFLEKSSNELADFHMRYLNADGGEVEMCGNGARSILHFAHEVLKLKKETNYTFTTLNSTYFGKAIENFPIRMTAIKDFNALDLADLTQKKDQFFYYLNTGVPHAIFEVDNLYDLDINAVAEPVRWDKRFPEGVNVNFFQIKEDQKSVKIRTFERGVEGETKSCGTGATAVALSLAKVRSWPSPLNVFVVGGMLEIRFNDDLSEVYLAGPVSFLGEGSLHLE